MTRALEWTDHRIVLLEVRAESRRIVRDGLREVAPDAVAAVELEDVRRQARARSMALDEVRFGMQVLDPAAMVKVVVL